MNVLFLATALVPLQVGVSVDEVEKRANTAFTAGVDSRADAVIARKHFAVAAAGYDDLWAEGDHRAGTAVQRGRSHFLAGNVPMAVVAFRAGLEWTPYDAELLRGLAECRAAIQYPTPAKPDEQLQPDPPRGWRYRISEWDVFRLAVIGVSLMLVGLARRFTNRDDWAVPVLVVGGVGVLACVVVEWTLQSESAVARERTNLVVMTDATLRMGNGFTHQPRIASNVPRGTEVVEWSRRGGWVQVEVAGGAVGWLPESATRRVD